MNTTPSIDELLEGLIFALSDEILPYLTNEKSQATAVMMQSIGSMTNMNIFVGRNSKLLKLHCPYSEIFETKFTLMKESSNLRVARGLSKRGREHELFYQD